MKKKGLIAWGILLFSALGSIAFQSCDKDTYSYLDVTVIEPETRRAVPNAAVTISASGSTVGDFGYTNDEGVYSTKFAAPAVFDVNARMFIKETLVDSISDPATITYTYRYYHRDGASSIRLKEGETVEATVYVNGDILPDSSVVIVVDVEESGKK